MAQRWIDISRIRSEARALHVHEFERIYPMPVLLAATIRQGRLISPLNMGHGTHLYLDGEDSGKEPKVIEAEVRFTPIHRQANEDFDPWTSIGRTNEADLMVNDYTVSKNHARMKPASRSDEFTVEDLGSRNGTWVNFVRVRKGEPTQLHNGEELRLGRQTFTFFTSAGFHDFLTTMIQ